MKKGKNMSKPRVSIIMGIFNVADTLDEAIESILQQTYHEWKMIMCDDGSTDETYRIAEKYVKEYPEQFLLIKNEKNIGLNATLNHCLEYVDTEYTARMDGDDISLPERLQKEVAFLDQNSEYALVSCPMTYFDENGVFRIGTDKGEPEISSFPKGSPFGHAPCVIRTTVLKQLNGYTVDDKLLRVEDWDLWIRLYEKGYKGFNLEESLYMMRDGRNAIKRRNFKNRLNEARVRASAVTKLHLPVYLYIFALRPIILGLMPNGIYIFLHRMKNRA